MAFLFLEVGFMDDFLLHHVRGRYHVNMKKTGGAGMGSHEVSSEVSIKIYYSSIYDPMLLATMKNMRALHKELQSFLASDEQSIRFPANQADSPEPYDELLRGFEVEKGEGPLFLGLTPERWLKLKGGVDNLAIYIEYFWFEDEEDEDGAHHHPEYVFKEDYRAKGTMFLIIEIGYW
jgi:hypothetical protein